MAGGLPEVTPGQPFRYTGEQADAETGLMHLRARQYDPGVGRLLQRDRVPGSLAAPTTLNRYAYVLNNPVNYTDPSGNCPNPLACAEQAASNLIELTSRCESVPAATGYVIGTANQNCTGSAQTVSSWLGSPAAYTVGSKFFSTGMIAADTAQHELAHVAQYEVLGGAFLPVYGLFEVSPLGPNPLESLADAIAGTSFYGP